jgi:hypothetical protein
LFDQGFLNKRPISSISADEKTKLPPLETFTMLAKMEKQHNNTSRELETVED